MLIAVIVLGIVAAILAVTSLVLSRGAMAARRTLDRTDAERRDEIRQLTDRVAVQDAALQSLAEGIVVFGSDGTTIYVNPAARELLGRRLTTVSQVTPELLRLAIEEAVRTDGPVESEVEVSGRTIHATVGPSGTSGDVVLVARDVTTARMVERVRRDFAANASHELKTPVASIQALSETLEEAVPRDPVKAERFLALLRMEADRLSRLVGDLLDLSRLEAESADRSGVRLDEIVGDEVRRLSTSASASGLLLEMEASEPVVVSGSPSDLGLLVHNLLDNAVRYSPDGGRVQVGVRERDGFATITVSDTGIGIGSRDLGRIFERFYRADPARSRETGGTGLGLSIVKHVAEAHGGDVGVQSVLGAGSTFTVRLPLAGPEPG